MKATRRILVAALAIAGLGMSVDAMADRGHRGAGVRAGVSHGGHWGGYRSHWYGPRLAFSFGVPVLIGAGYWGYPSWGGYYGPRETVVYREVIREPEPMESGREAPAPSEPRTSAERAPNAGPLYMNYCESSRQYYPDVSSCPEGWKFITPNS